MIRESIVVGLKTQTIRIIPILPKIMLKNPIQKAKAKSISNYLFDRPL